MKITQKELEQELISLKAFGLTIEELEGYVEFYEGTLEVEPVNKKIIWVLNTGRRKSRLEKK